MMDRNIRLAASVAVASSFAFVATGHAADPEPIKFGDYEARILLNASVEQNDNVFRSAVGEESTQVARFSPVVNITNNNSDRSLELNYTANAVYLTDFNDDSYLAQALDATALFAVAKEQRLGFGVAYTDGREARGTGSGQGGFQSQVSGVTQFTEVGLEAIYEYGDEKSPLQVDATLAYSDQEFDNFRSFTAQRDHGSVGFAAEFDYQLSAATSFFVDVALTELDYSNPAPAVNNVELDSTDTRIHVGLAWSATKNTTGRVGFGATQKELDNVEANDSFASWDAAIDWLPSANDTVSVETERRTVEAAGQGAFIVQATYGVNWAHAFSPSVSGDVFISAGAADFQRSTREDDDLNYGATVTYAFSPTMDLEFSYRYEEKDSNFDLFRYEQNVVMASISMGL